MAAGPPVLKARQSGTASLTGTSLGVTVTAYVPAHSILFFSWSGGDSTIPGQRGLVRAEKTNGTTITFYRGASGGASCEVRWELLEFTEDFNVEDVVESGGGTANTTLGADSYFIISLGSTHTSPTTLDGDTTAELQLTSTTNARRICGGSTGGTWSYQCIQTALISGVQQISGSASSQTTDPTISSVTVANALSYATGRTSGSYDTEDVYRHWILDSTHLRLNRGASSGPTWNYTIFVLDLPSAFTPVIVTGQSSDSGTNYTVSHSAVETRNSSLMAKGVHQCGMANIALSGVSSQDTNLAMCSLARESDTSFRVIRNNGGGNIELSWQTWESNAESAGGVVHENIATSSGGWGAGPFTWNHTISGNANRLLTVIVAANGNNDADTLPSAVTYNGQAMTLAVTHQSSTGGFHTRCSVYYLLDANLPSAGAYQVSVTMPSASQAFNACSVDYSDAAQATYEASATNQSTSAPQTVGPTSITTVTDGAVIVDAVAMDGNPDGTPFTGIVKDVYSGVSGGGLLAGHRHTPTAEAYVHGWNLAYSTNRYAQIVLAFAPAGGVTVDLSGQSDGDTTVSGSLQVTGDLEGQSDGSTTVSGQLSVSGECTLAIETSNVAQGNAGSSVSHTLTDSPNRIVIVMIDDESETQATGVTYDGEAMTLVASSTATAGAGNASSMWAILEADLPASPGSYSVSVSGLDSGASVSVVEIHGAAQVIPSGAAVDTTETGATNTSSAVATAPSGTSISVGCLGMGNDSETINDPPTGTGTWLRLFNINAPPSSARMACGYQFWDSSGSKTYTETATGTDWFRSSQIHAIFAECVPGVVVPLNGASDGDTTVSGSLNVLTDLEGDSDGAATVSGTLSPVRGLEGDSDGAATVSGSLNVLTQLEGDSDGAATVAGSLSVMRTLEGDSDGAATVAGSLNVLTALQGQSDGATTVAAVLIETDQFTGASAGVAVVSGSLAVLTALQGQADGAATVAGSLGVLTQLAGASDGATSVTGALSLTVDLAAVSDGFATVSGALGVLTALQGQADGSTAVSGSLNVLTQLAGQSDGSTTVAAVLIETDQFTGQSDGSSVVAGSLNVLTALQGAADGSSVVDGSLGVRRPLTGSSAGQGAASASLNVLTDLQGQSDGSTTVAGTLIETDQFTGQSDGSSVVAGALNVLTALQGQSDGSSVVSGSLSPRRGLAGEAYGSTVTISALNVQTDLQGQSDGVTDVGAFLGVLVDLQGQSDGSTTVTADLQENLVDLSPAQSDGSTTVAGALNVLTLLTGQSAGAASAIARLNVTWIHLEGESDGRARVSGSLSEWQITGRAEVIDQEIQTRTEVISDAAIVSRVKVIS